MLGAPCPACTQVCTLIYMCNLHFQSNIHACVESSMSQVQQCGRHTVHGKYSYQIFLYVLCVNVPCRLWKEEARFCSKRPELEAQHFYFPTRLLLDQTCLDIPGHNRMPNRASLGKWFSNILPQSHREGLLKRWLGPPSGFLIPEIWMGPRIRILNK